MDSIKGVDGIGPVKVQEILGDVSTELELFERVRDQYQAKYGDDGDSYLLETGRLLWMTRELNEDGSPVLWKFPQ